ncbi:MAG TPA: TetR/AcrR family transcriptional regulator [Thermoleophilaceae bacterium]|nr:TetR/AcrR family transcriptional regulator [Thermoleophilaceae bacterium]
MPTSRRQDILDAALAAFTENGFAAATVDDVRRRSGASVGSIYHHFGGKQELAEALYAKALRDYQRGFLRVLGRTPGAEPGVRGLVRHHLRWVARHPDLARWMLRWRGGGEAIDELNRELFAATRAWLEPHVESGRIRSLPLDLTYVILIGPAQEFSRHWLERRLRTSMAEAERVLPEAAWNALRGGEGAELSGRPAAYMNVPELSL